MANDLYWFIIPLILPALITRFGLSFGGGGGILTFYLGITAAGSFIIGKLSDKMDRRKIIGIGFMLASCGLTASGYAPTLPLFLLLLAITSIGTSSFHPVMYAIIMEGGEKGRARTLSIYETCGTIAVLVMFLVNGFLIERIGVRGVLAVTAVPGFIMGLFFLISRSEKSIQTERLKSDVPAVKQRGGRTRIILFLLSVILRVSAITAILNFLPVIFVTFAGFSVEFSSYSTAFFFAGGVIGSLSAGKLTEIWSSYKILLGATVLLIPTLLSFGMNIPGELLLPVVFIMGLLGSGSIINQNLILARLGKEYGRGEIFGILMGTMTVASAVSPSIYGISIDNFGLQRTQFFLTIPLLLSAIVLFYMIKKENKTGTAEDR